MNTENELTWKQIFDLSTPEEREEITVLMVAYVEKKRELIEDPFPFTRETRGELSWLQRKRLLAYVTFMNVKQMLKDTLPKHITLFNNLILLIVGVFEYFRFEYLRRKKIRDTDYKMPQQKENCNALTEPLQMDGSSNLMKSEGVRVIDYRPELRVIGKSFWKRMLFEGFMKLLLFVRWMQNIPIRWIEYQINHK